MGHDRLMLAVDQHTRRIVVFYREINQADPGLLGWVDTRGGQDIVVNLKMGGLDITLEIRAIKPLYGPFHQLFRVLPVVAVFPPIVDDGSYPFEYLPVLVPLHGSGRHERVEKVIHRAIFSGDRSRELYDLERRLPVGCRTLFETGALQQASQHRDGYGHIGEGA